MAPKKKPLKQINKTVVSPLQNSSHKKPSKPPKLLLSPEEEERLRRLLLSSRRTSSPVKAPILSALVKAQTKKKLINLYDKLSCEGFSNDQIESALSSLIDRATFESALDWLCLNFPSLELPLKFSSGASRFPTTCGSVGVISTSREDLTESGNSLVELKQEEPEVLIRVKSKRDEEEDTLSSCQLSSQADWIRQYMRRLEEEEMESSDEEVPGPRPFDEIAEEYCLERSDAVKAKRKGDERGQKQAGLAICKLKQELSAGISEGMLESEFLREQCFEDATEKEVTSTMPDDVHQLLDDLNLDENLVGSCNSEESQPKALLLYTSGQESVMSEDVLDDMKLGDLFLEDVPPYEPSPLELQELQKKEIMRELCNERNLEKLKDIWKKGQSRKIPKAILHQLCQKSGWEAPRFNKVTGEGSSFSYTITVMVKSSGCCKSRQAGDLVTLKLPHQAKDCESIEDAQNRVAAFALHKLFSDLPVYFAITEPYASLVLIWKQEESLGIQSSEEERRAKFVDSLLEADNFNLTTSLSGKNGALSMADSCVKENDDLDVVKSNHRAKRDSSIEAECSSLKRKQENKKKIPKYKDMLKARAALPISELKNDILQHLKEKDVLVVCGETGSGKTTQVPQFILDDMIESERGGYCNIICTQPRRMAAISVAQRVVDERCESPPGVGDSLVGYQIRHQSARSEKTRLLFCTTGTLLRKLGGDKTLKGVSHIIVDEVHERSLKGDFLLIFLKRMIEKQSCDKASPKLKVILMSATIDADRFSRYFGQCPVVTAQGRTHPVTTYFLEEIYEKTKYLLAPDSPAALRSDSSNQDELGPVKVHRGKKNHMLAGWGENYMVSEDCLKSSYVSTNYEAYSVIDYELLEELICHIDANNEEGAILVFLPGMSEISMLLNRLSASDRFRGLSAKWLLPLHSSIGPKEQQKVFWRPPKGIRKVIVATNIAETSITIEDVVYAIDSGKHKEKRYNPQKKLSSMVEDWISKANARQRMGRAGRVKPGICFSLYTRHRFEKLMRPYQVPEMLREPLVGSCLQIKSLGLGHIKPFMSKATLEPPSEGAINSAISLLRKVGAVEGDEELTPLGHHLAKLPVDVLIGKMLLYGGIFGCLSPILSIAAFLSDKSPFTYPKDQQNVDRVKLALLCDKLESSSNLNNNDKQSDHLLMMVAYEKWAKILHEQGFQAAERFCDSKFLSSSVMQTIRDMRIQFGTLLADIGLINLPKSKTGERRKDNLDVWFSDKTQPFNMYSQEPEVVKAISCAGLCPNIAEGLVNRLTKPEKQTQRYAVWHDGRREVHIDHTSINKNCKAFQYPFLVFFEKVESKKLVYLRDTTIVSPFSILLFGGSVDVHHQSGTVTIDGWLNLAAPAQTAVLFKELRLTLHSILKDLIQKPEKSGIVHNEVVKAMVHFLIEEGKQQRS
ncbi:DExH-box ATP-dependent RNA helicase DExH4, chloroplastic [Eutrema salsugineum]|uniref:DExH-box ATP-dependent RNA helicase DExH4, chloroplastic n=1 Tax=Eutrema salsugineum TaxID=72664 RepID=UPI000CED1386|nr:DExH-box ATP-dependent RNA helicase DExH4, chloroplastic [Eutrema salsugineum]